ncbi:metallophosphoesterase family protein [Sphingomonas sp.]|uniref:metallophosphoesterase family protein n=1 Tax=Sphingomonas sp. TaxID=28214 RepID=UPI0035C818DF
MVQLSDLHFGAGKQNVHPAHQLLEHVVAVVKEQQNSVVLASGDITYQALDAGYREATHFFEQLLDRTGLDRSRFLFCPGNHDCHATGHFKAFDTFTYGIRRDNECTFSGTTCRLLAIDGLNFLLMNSSHHLDHRYGLADVDALGKLAPADPANCVAVIHHHLIPTDKMDPSTTRNAHEVLLTLDDKGVPILLHGHQHVAKGVAVGRTPVNVLGVNSFNFHVPGGQNAIGLLNWRDDGVSFSRRVLFDSGLTKSSAHYKEVDRVTIR